MGGARPDAEPVDNRSGDPLPAQDAGAITGAGAGDTPAAQGDRVDGRVRSTAASVMAWAFGAFNAIPTAILGFLSLWLFVFFPWLRPWEPPVERKVTIANVTIAEPRFTFPSTQEPMTVVLFDVEAVGYDAVPLEVATLWLDAATGERVGANLDLHGKLTKPTRTDTSVVWLDVPQPPPTAFPRSASGQRPPCFRVRVLIFVAPKEP